MALEDCEEGAPLDLGSCCACSEAPARNIIMLNKKAPVPSTGWGCVLCGLPADGAFTVLCDACLEEERPPLFACHGYALTRGRVPIGDLVEVFEHDMANHPGET